MHHSFSCHAHFLPPPPPPPARQRLSPESRLYIINLMLILRPASLSSCVIASSIGTSICQTVNDSHATE
jgi:hypothetical protein